MNQLVRDLAAAKVAEDILADIARRRKEFRDEADAANAAMAASREAAAADAETAAAARGTAVAKAGEATQAASDIEAMKAEIDEAIANNIPGHEWDGTLLRLRSPNGNWGIWVNLAGAAGKNAYALALDEGFEGSIVEWLASLVGPKGDKPAHAWFGTSLVFENPDGSPGESVDLVGPIGPAGAALRPRGAYSGAAAYAINDVVRDQGSSWVAVTSTTDNAPPTLPSDRNDYWELLAQKGSTGPSGEGAGDMAAETYDPNGVADDAFAMENMVEGSTKKILTASERTKLANIEALADVTDAANVAAAGAFMKSDDTTDNITEGSTKKFTTAARNTKVDYLTITASFNVDAAATKLGLLTVTAPTDLDFIRTRVAELDAVVIFKGDWDASASTFPGSGAAQAGWSYVVTVAGTVNGVAFAVGDQLIAKADNASTSTYAGNWIRVDNVDAVTSVAGRVGSVTLTADDFTDGSTNKAYTGTEKTKLAGIATGATANSADATLLARANHTGTQSADTITDGSTNKAYTGTEKTKLAGIATAATANSSDATLLGRANHTGTQSADTITDGSTNKAYTGTEKTKLAGIEAAADVTDAANVAAAGASMVGASDFVLPAGGARPRTTNGSTSYSSELATNDIMLVGQEFSASTEQACQWNFAVPKSVNPAASLSGQIRWTTIGGSSGNCIWGIRARATSNDDAMDGSWGTAVEVTDGFLAAGDDHVIAFSGLTPGGSWASGDKLWVEVYRKAADGADTLNGTSILMDVKLTFTTNAGNDA